MRRGVGRKVLVGVGALAAVVVAAACAPLPPDALASLCPPQASALPPGYVGAARVSYSPEWPSAVPAPAVEVLDRLSVIPGDFTVSADSFVTVRLTGWDAAGRDLAARLRSEFGAQIDIEVGAKRLGGGPNGRTGSCVITAPRWSIAAAPTGLSVQVITAPSYDRTAPVTATLRITNQTRRAVWVAPAPAGGWLCDAGDIGESLARPGTALNVNRAKGLLARNDPAPAAEQSLGLGSAMPLSGEGGQKWAPVVCTAELRLFLGTRIAPRGHADLPVAASTTSVMAGDDPVVGPGRYDLRATFAVLADSRSAIGPYVPATGAVAPWKVVAAPPVSVTLR